MEKLIKKLIDERRVTLFLALVLAVVGIYGYYLLPRQENPDVSAPIAMIVTPYPGASPKDVNELVSKKIEDEMAELDNYDYVKSISQDSVSVVIVYFETSADSDKAMQDVRNAMTDVTSQLPSGVLQSDIKTDLTETAGMIISLSGENYSYEQLASFGEQFKDALIDVEGVSKFNIEGELKKEVKVVVDMAKLDQLGLSLMDLDKYLMIQNIEIPSGYLDTEDGKIKLKAPGIFESVSDIENLVIGVSTETGVTTKLSDVADIYMGLEDGAEKFKQNGNNAVLLTGYFQDSKNVVLIGKEVREKIEAVKAGLPSDLIVEEVVYQPDAVSSSTNEFMRNLLAGIALVIIVVFFGLGFRNAIVVSTAIPLSILMTFGAMYFMGIKIHQISLTALIIALGILVDNAIVISDTVQVRYDGGASLQDAAIRGTSASATPIFTATLTTIAAFSPLLGLPGAAGQFIAPIPLVLIISMVAAYIVAMFVTPAMAVTFFKKSEKKTERSTKLRLFFSKMLSRGLSKKKQLTLGTFGVLVAVIVIVVPMLPSQFFPYADKDILYIDIDAEQAGNIDYTEDLADEVVAALADVPELTSYTVAVGNGMPKFYVTMPPATPSKSYSQLVCHFDLETANQRFNTKMELKDYLQKKLDSSISKGSTSVKLLEYAEPQAAKVVVRVSGKNFERISEVVSQLEDQMNAIDDLASVSSDKNPLTYQMNLDVDKAIASSMGITTYDVQSQINVALYGKDSTVFRKDGKEYAVNLKSNAKSESDLYNMEIKSSLTEKKIPLRQFASIGFSKKQDTINNYEREEAIHIYGIEKPGRDPVAIETYIEDTVLPSIDTTGVKVTFDGEREQVSKYFGAAGTLAGGAIFLIFVILIVQFNSFMQALIILMTIPLSLIGSVIGLFIFRQPLSFTAVLGIIALIGLVVKNGILLIEYINDARKEGDSIDEACIDAVNKRFNAIILSSMTTILGLFPLAISGSDLFAPMAVSLMSGLAVSTFLTLVVIPVMYSLFETTIEKKVNNKSAVL
jgi:multidrug efflux pump subunit AcrB